MRISLQSGDTFERMTVIKTGEKDKWGHPLVTCECKCGEVKIVVANDLTRGAIKSCGCLSRDNARKRLLIHNAAKDFPHEYRAWRNMRQRIINPQNPGYKYYGAIGIKVCERWDLFENFFEDMGLAPGPQFGVKRKNIEENFDNDNCYWGTNRDCIPEPPKRTSRALDLRGQKYGRLTPRERVENASNGASRWLCDCECGGITIATTMNLRSGNSQSCGCLRIETLAKINFKHGIKFFQKEYSAHTHMKRRCYHSGDELFYRYGGRGIKVCDRWLGDNGFENFLDDMGPCPGSEYTIERLDNDGDYCPENCVWATRKEQANNTSRNVKLIFRHKCQTATQWAEELGIDAGMIRRRKRRGWSDEEALIIPMGGRRCLV